MDRLWQVLLRAADGDQPLSCEDCFVLMDTLSELLSEGYPLEDVFAVAERYLRRCPECDHEFQRAMADLFLVQVPPHGAHSTSIWAIDLPLRP